MVFPSVRALGVSFPPRRDRRRGSAGAVLLAAAWLCQGAEASAQAESTTCRDRQDQPRDCSILLVHSYHPALGWTRKLSYGFGSALGALPRLRIDTEYLDAKRRPGLPHAEAFLETLEAKYRSHPPDVLVIADDPAFELLWGRRRELFPGVPVVFMGLNEVRADVLQAPQVTGIFERHHTEATIDLALELTKAEGIVVINDTSATGRANEATINRMIEAHPEVRWVIVRDLVESQVGQLTQHPSHWPIVPMLPLREAGARGPMLSQRRSVEILRSSLPNPLFYSADWLMGRGIVGGYMLLAREHAHVAGELVAEILAGHPTESLPPRFETAHAWMFDSRELERFGWRLGDLPAGAKLRYASHSLWHKHRNLLIPIAFVLLTAAFVVAVLFATVRRQHRAELALLAQKQRLSTALTASAAGVFEIHGSRVYASSRWLELVGADRSDAQLPEGWMRKASDESRARFLETIRRLSETVGRERLEIEIVSEPRVLDVLLTTADGEAPRGVVGVATDITHRRRMETEASSRTRLQALGELAGGIAHDFNNILTVINGTAELIRDVRDLDEIRAGLDQIEGSGARAAELVRKLLLFGRRDHRASRPIDLNTPIRNLHGFLRPLVGETHEVVTILHDEPLGVPLDAAHVEQLLSNLVINARDALPEGGPIHVSTGTAWVEGTEWAILRVSDAGIGMSEEVRARIFEPFFTTKPVGGGSGLGLSTVWGIVSGSGGEVRVDSAPGAGTTVTARWARLDLPEVITGPMTPLPVAHGRSILLVEDDPGVAYVTETLLQGAGYRVRHAADGREGLQMFESQPDDFDLVFSDLVLPHLSGVEMVDRIRKLRPTVRVGFLTGYAHHPSLARVVSPPDRELLRKPFSKRELQEYVSGRLTPR